ncbi:MAG: prepilin-type N-terminal cleavage/methylation domain-containing protein, partial [Actinobacteria bacterium]|nr:prepilin-type N-terminal cleavage/methylation domain-containing protein [Actinomycetota bacterium]
MNDPRPYWRRCMRPQRNTESGFTLIELVMAVVLSGLIAGVIVAALVTSLNIADSALDQVHDSVDASLVSAFLYRDAQAAGGVDPTLAQLDPSIGVSTSDAGSCGVPSGSTLVMRFSWLDRQTVTTRRTVTTTYSFDAANKKLTRRICQDGTTTDAVLARTLSSVSATCTPACTGLPSFVTLALAGSGIRSPFSYALSASLRPQNQIRPTTNTASTVSVLAMGGSASACPNLKLSGTSTITVVGDATVGSDCTGAGPQSGAQTLSFINGGLSTLAGLTDPFSTLAAPAGTCAGTTNPTPN